MKKHLSRNYLTKDEFNLFHQEIKRRYPDRPELTFFTGLLFRHGMRRDEARLLEKRHFNTKEDEIFCHRLKNGLNMAHSMTNRDRDEHAEMVSYHTVNTPGWAEKNADSPYLVLTRNGTPLDPDVVAEIYIKLGVVVFNQRLKCHDLRHSCAYNLLLNNTNLYIVKQYMGHKFIENTCSYLPALDEEVANVSSILA